MVYRPTIYHLLRFVAPILEGEVTKPTNEIASPKHRRSLSSSSSVSSIAPDSDQVSVSSRAAELITNKSRNLAKAEQSKPLPADWEKKQVKVILKLKSIPRPDHAADALADCICYCSSLSLKDKIGL